MPRAARSASERVFPIIWETIAGASPRGRLCGALVLGMALATIGPDRLARGPRLCLIRAVIRRPCPACGMTRAASALLRGDVRRAMRMNPRILLVTFVCGVILLGDLRSVMKR